MKIYNSTINLILTIQIKMYKNILILIFILHTKLKEDLKKARENCIPTYSHIGFSKFRLQMNVQNKQECEHYFTIVKL